jgi:hypothetical protein
MTLFGKPALKQLQQRTDLPGAALFHILPFFGARVLMEIFTV